MSNLFLKNTSNNTTESSLNLTNILGMNNNIIGGTSNITSSINLSKINSADINTLLSMLTSESDNNTSTLELENKLKNMLNQNELKNTLQQNGGSKEDNNTLSQTSNINTENTGVLENKLNSLLKQNGGNTEISTEVLENKINNIIQNNQTGGSKHLLTFATLGIAGTLLNNNITSESEYDTTKVLGKMDNTPKYNMVMPRKVMPYIPPQNINMPYIPPQNINMPIPPQNINMPYIPSQNINMPPIPSQNINMPTQNSNMSIFQPNNNKSPFDSITSSDMPNNLSTLSETSNNSIFAKPNKPTNNTITNPFIPFTATTTDLSPTSSFMPYTNSSITNKNDSRLLQLNQNGGNNPGMIVFRELSALVSKKLNIKNGPQAKKIASQLQKDVKAQNEGITHDKLLNAAEKYLTNNIKKYEKLIK